MDMWGYFVDYTNRDQLCRHDMRDVDDKRNSFNQFNLPVHILSKTCQLQNIQHLRQYLHRTLEKAHYSKIFKEWSV